MFNRECAIFFVFLNFALAGFPPHDWNSGNDMLWADWSPNPNSPDWPLNPQALADMAQRYRIHSLEQCFGCKWSAECNASEANVIDTARGLKAAAASAGVREPVVLMYVQGSMPRSCFASNTEYMAHPEWFLRFDSHAWAGQPVRRNPLNQNLNDNTLLNYQNASARAWFGAQAWKQPEAREVIDGIFADSIGWTNWHDRYAANISWNLTYSLNNASLQMLSEAKAQGYEAIMYNGIEVNDRYAPNWDEGALAVTDGANIEHWGAFECILPDGSMNTSMFSAVILQAYLLGNDGSGKGIFIKGWPGPVVAPIFFLPEDEWGLHRMTPSWPSNTTPLTPAARSQALLYYFPYFYATFLMAAGSTSYFHYAWWYDLCDGTSPVCLQGSAWADLGALLNKRTGAPLGAPIIDGPLISRKFEHLTVSVDLGNYSSATFLWSAFVTIEVDAVLLGIPSVVYNVSVPLSPHSHTSVYAAMQNASQRDPLSLVFEERLISGHPFVISFGPLPCTRERCWYYSVNNVPGTSAIDEALVEAGDVVRWDYLKL